MSRGSAGMTGSNSLPLGTDSRRPAAVASSLLTPNYLSKPPPAPGPTPGGITNYEFPNMRNPDFPNMPYRPPGMQNMVVPLGTNITERKRTADARESRSRDKSDESREDRKKKRRSRWTDEACKTFIPGLPTMIPTGLSKQQEEAYLCRRPRSRYTRVTGSGSTPASTASGRSWRTLGTKASSA